MRRCRKHGGLTIRTLDAVSAPTSSVDVTMSAAGSNAMQFVVPSDGTGTSPAGGLAGAVDLSKLQNVTVTIQLADGGDGAGLRFWEITAIPSEMP